MSKINCGVDLLKVQGSSVINREGKYLLIINLAKSRVRLKDTEGGKAAYLNLDVVANKDGPNQWGNTHFVAEVVTKEERQSGVKGAIIGNGKEFTFDKPKPQRREETADDWNVPGGGSHDDSSDIPFAPFDEPF